MIHCQLPANVSYAKLADPAALDDFVGVFLVSVYPGNAPDWIVYAAGNAAEQHMLTIDNGNVSLVWNESRGNICNSGGAVPRDAVSMLRVSRQYGVWELTWTGQPTQPAVVSGDEGPIFFDLIGATGIDRPGQAGYSTPGCHVLAAVIMPGHPTAEDVARVEVGMAGYQLS